jgi:hypothetical protein
MKNETKRILAASVIAALLGGMPNQALAAGPVGSYQSEIFCGNTSAADATIQVDYYDEAGAVASTVNDTVPANQSKIIVVNAPAGFRGAGVVSSEASLACSVNMVKTGVDGTAGNPARLGTSESVSSENTGATLFAPQAAKGLGNATVGFYNSFFSVQNTDGSDVSVDITYIDRTGTTYAGGSITVKANSSKAVYLEDVVAVPAGFLGGVKVVGPSSAKLAGTMVMFNDGTGTSKAQILNYNMATSGSNKLSFPQFVVNYYGYNSGFTIMNVDAVDANVQITFNMANGQAYVFNTSVQAGKVLAPFAPNIAALQPLASVGVGQRTGSAIVTSTGGKIVANLNQRHDGICYAQGPTTPDCSAGAVPNAPGAGTAFMAFLDGTATAKMYIPVFNRRVGGATFNSGIKVANATATATTCSVEFPGDSDANIASVALSANGSFDLFAPNVANLNDGYQNSVVITCGQPAFASYNLRSDNSAYLGDATSSANAPGVTQ